MDHKACSTICALALAWVTGACTPPPVDPMPGDGCPPEPVRSKTGTISGISTEDFVLLHQSGGLLLIDARHPWFYSQGRIPGAINLPTDEGMDERIKALRPDFEKATRKGHPIVVYCNGFGCHDARTASKAIAAAGFNVTKFNGGWTAWKNFDLPVESASQEGGDLSPQPAS